MPYDYDIYAASEPHTPGALDWPAFKTLVMDLYRKSTRSPHTARGMRFALDAMPLLGVTNTSELTVGLIARYVDGCPASMSANTIRSRLRAIRVYCRMAAKLGYVRVDPFDVRPLGAWVRPAPSLGRKHHSRDDIKRVLTEMARQASEFTGWEGWRGKRLYFLTSLLAYTGLRASEAYHLQVIDLDLAGSLHIVSRAENRLKTYASAATIPLAPPMIPIAREWLASRMSVPPGFPHDSECPWLIPTIDRRHPWTSGSPGAKPRDRMVFVGRQAGVDGFNPMSLRHSLATHLISAGAGRSEVQRMLRHTNEKTQEAYLHFDLENMRRLISRIEF